MKKSHLTTNLMENDENSFRNRNREKKLIDRTFVDSFFYLFSIYSNYHDRTSRKEYFSFILIFCFFAFLLIKIGIEIVVYIYLIIFFLPLFSNTIRRLHDSGHAGWYLMIPFYDIYLLLKRGDEGDNTFGSDPLYELD